MAKKITIMTDYVGMGCKIDLLGRVSVHKKGKQDK